MKRVFDITKAFLMSMQICQASAEGGAVAA